MFGADSTAASHADEEVDDEVDGRVDLAVGGGDVRAAAGDGENRENSTEGDLALPFHNGLSQNREIGAKLGVLLDPAGEGAKVVRYTEGDATAPEKIL